MPCTYFPQAPDVINVSCNKKNLSTTYKYKAII